MTHWYFEPLPILVICAVLTVIVLIMEFKLTVPEWKKNKDLYLGMFFFMFSLIIMVAPGIIRVIVRLSASF